MRTVGWRAGRAGSQCPRHAAIAASGEHNPTAIVDISGTGIRSFYVEDPDGIPVELLQMTSG